MDGLSDIVTIGDCTLYHADCMDVLPTLPKVDAVVTDPPYGIAYKSTLPGSAEHEIIKGDIDGVDVRAMLRMDCFVLAFGANCYPEQLPHRGRWVCWDKRGGIERADKMLGSPFELAWTNKTSGFDIMIRIMHGGVVNDDGIAIPRQHPTQKPIQLMERCIGLSKTTGTVLDPFMGSGTTGIACVNLGRKFIGIEKERKYFDIACERIQRATNQGKLFTT